MNTATTSRPSIIQFMARLIKRVIDVDLTQEEQTELHIFYAFPDSEHKCYVEKNYTRFGILESLRRKGYIYQAGETNKWIHYKLCPEKMP